MLNIVAVLLSFDPNQSARSSFVGNTSIWRTMADALHQSLDRILMLLIAILPGILAFLVALAVFTLIGMALSALLRHGLAAIRLDERLADRRGNSDWTPSTSPTTLIARVSFWGCILLGLIIGVSAFDASYATASTLPSTLLPYLTRVVGAAVLLIAGTLSARFLARSVLIGAVNEQLQYARFLSLGIKWLVLVLTAAMVLEHLSIGGNIVSLAFAILFGGIVLTLALAVGLGSRDLIIRSLQNHAEHSHESNTAPTTNSPDYSIRHF
jgi:hypothetical protein